MPDGAAVTTRKLDSNALLETAERLAHMGTWDFDPTTRELRWSDGHFRLYGLEPAEITPTPEYVFARLHPDDHAAMEGYQDVLKRDGVGATVDFRILHPAGCVRHLRSTAAIVEGEPPQLTRIIGSTQDVTEELRAEREIVARAAVSEALSSWESFERGGQQLLRSLGETMAFDVGTLWVVQGEVLVARLFWQEPGLAVYDFLSVTEDLRVRLGAGLPGLAWKLKEPVNVARISEDDPGRYPIPFNVRRRAAYEAGMCGAVAIPAVVGEEVIAVLDFFSREEAELTDRLMRTLKSIGLELGHFLAHRRGELEPPILTPRELQVLSHAAQGLTGREIAGRLGVSPATVKTHFENIYDRLGVSDRASAVAKALRRGLID